MTDENFKRLESIVNDINKEASIKLVISKQFNQVGVHLEPYKDNWYNLEGNNLLGQIRILAEVTKDVR
jgi:hypothetical protein